MNRKLMLVLAMLLCASLLFGCSVSRNSGDADTVKDQKQDQREESTPDIDIEDKADSEQDEQDNDKKSVSEDKKDSESGDKSDKKNKDSGIGKKDSPVPKGSTYTWTGTTDSYYKIEYTYSLTVNDAKPVTIDELKEMNVRVNEDDRFEYRILDVSCNAEIKLLGSESGSAYISSFYPHIVGAESSAGESVIGYAFFGFEDALKDNISDQVGFDKIDIDETASYSADGKVIIPVYKGKTNYLVLRDDGSGDKIYFSIE